MTHTVRFYPFFFVLVSQPDFLGSRSASCEPLPITSGNPDVPHGGQSKHLRSLPLRTGKGPNQRSLCLLSWEAGGKGQWFLW